MSGLGLTRQDFRYLRVIANYFVLDCFYRTVLYLELIQTCIYCAPLLLLVASLGAPRLWTGGDIVRNIICLVHSPKHETLGRVGCLISSAPLCTRRARLCF